MSSYTFSPAWAGFLKGVFLAAVMAIVTFVGDASNLSGILNPMTAALVAAIASAIESSMKASAGGSVGMFGAIDIR